MDPLLIIYLPAVSTCSICMLTYLVNSLLALAARVAARQHARSQLKWLEESQCLIAGAGAAHPAGRFGPHSYCSSKQEASSTTSCVDVEVEAIDDKADEVEAEGGPRAELVECVFCLSDVEDGEEVRELSCRHVFHRGCLDKWLAMQARATCPLCRGALVPDEASAEAEAGTAAAVKHEGGAGGDDGGEVDDLFMVLSAFVCSRWLARCITLVSNMCSRCKPTAGLLNPDHRSQ